MHPITEQDTLDTLDTRDTLADRNKAVVTRFLQGTHGGDFDVVFSTVAPQIRTHGFPGGHNPASLTEYRDFFVAWDRAFPDMQFQIDSLLAEGELVAARFTIRAHHRGEFAGVPATGNPVAFSGMVIYRLQQGLIVETFLQPDTVSLLQQLGVLAA